TVFRAGCFSGAKRFCQELSVRELRDAGVSAQAPDSLHSVGPVSGCLVIPSPWVVSIWSRGIPHHVLCCRKTSESEAIDCSNFALPAFRRSRYSSYPAGYRTALLQRRTLSQDRRA